MRLHGPAKKPQSCAAKPVMMEATHLEAPNMVRLVARTFPQNMPGRKPEDDKTLWLDMSIGESQALRESMLYAEGRARRLQEGEDPASLCIVHARVFDIIAEEVDGAESEAISEAMQRLSVRLSKLTAT